MRRLARFAVLVFVGGVLLGSSTTPILEIASRSFSEDSVLSLDVVFTSPSEITVYSWRGHIYPLLGFGLTVTAEDLHGRPLAVESVAKMLPKLPHKHDTVSGTAYKYPEPLMLRLLDGHSEPMRGCANVQLEYDLTSDRSGNFRRAGLDLLRVHSNKIRVCNAEE